jgi:purine-binding chemotaxis protein CheW
MSQYLTFFLGDHELALPLLQVRQIIEHVPPTFVPHMPEAIPGVINLRGALVPVVDLARRFGLPTQPVSRTSCIVVVDAPAVGLLGLLADAVKDVAEIEPEGILEAPDFGPPLDKTDLVGVAQVGEKLALVLDTAKVLSPEELLRTTDAREAAA